MTDVPGGHGVAALRAATRPVHERLDRLVDLRAWDRATHQWWLQRMLGLHEPLERELAAWAEEPVVAARRRSPQIEADLRTLGMTAASVRALPRSPLPPLPPAPAGSRALGQLYVLDGSALGGAVIAHHAIAAGVPENACTSLAHSKARIVCWRETRQRLDDLGPDALAQAVRAAVELFAVFEAWLHTPAPGRPTLHQR